MVQTASPQVTRPIWDQFELIFHHTLHGGITRQNWYDFVQNYLKFIKLDMRHL